MKSSFKICFLFVLFTQAIFAYDVKCQSSTKDKKEKHFDSAGSEGLKLSLRSKMKGVQIQLQVLLRSY